jgi:hypothetical protein
MRNLRVQTHRAERPGDAASLAGRGVLRSQPGGNLAAPLEAELAESCRWRSTD